MANGYNVNPLAPGTLTMVVSEGTNLYGVCSDNSIWFAPGVIPLVWSQLPSVPSNEIPIWIGTTLGAINPPPGTITQHMFVVSRKGALWSWDGTHWNQRNNPYGN